MNTNEKIFRSIYEDLKIKGKKFSPRNQETLEIENYMIKFPPYMRFCNFSNRNYSLDYVKKEFLWYLKGDKKDLSIIEHAKMWKKFVDDGIIHSNYGQYIFKRRFYDTARTLLKDKSSRRASLVILQPYHLKRDIDIPCTYGINFRIRDNKLNMTIKMRSNDAYFGLASDLPIFSFIQEMMFVYLKHTYKKLELGEYCHFVESFHIYKKHYEFLNNLGTYKEIDCPRISSRKEVEFLIRGQYALRPHEYEFTDWLLKDVNNF